MATSGSKAESREATRAAILAAARRHFQAASYEQVGMRAIAATAGVNLALINRYFGTKAGLFRAAMAEPDFAHLFGDSLEAVPEHLARYIAHTATHESGHEQLMALLRSAQNPQAAEMLRERIEQDGRPLAEQLGTADAMARTELAIAVLLGVGIVRNVLHTEHLSKLDPEALQRLIVPVFMASLCDPEADRR